MTRTLLAWMFAAAVAAALGRSRLRAMRHRKEGERLLQRMTTPEAQEEWRLFMKHLYEQGVRHRAGLKADDNA